MVYLHLATDKDRKRGHFKTSYVMVYRVSTYQIRGAGDISKHLMLWFIYTAEWAGGVWMNFKTSYVMVYRTALEHLKTTGEDFKTSYVMVYLI